MSETIQISRITQQLYAGTFLRLLTDVIYNNDALNKSEIAVLLYLTTFINNEGTCSASHAQIANATKYDKRIVQRTIYDLLRRRNV